MGFSSSRSARLISRGGRSTLSIRLGLAALLSSCAADPAAPPAEQDLICPVRPENEFGPSHCALVSGVARNRDGQPLRGVAIRVDSVLCCLLFVYSSTNGVTGQDGSFSLEVGRTAILTPPTVPDTARLDLLLYYHDPRPAALDPSDARAPVLMWFAEVGKPVQPTVVDVRFDYPE